VIVLQDFKHYCVWELGDRWAVSIVVGV